MRPHSPPQWSGIATAGATELVLTNTLIGGDVSRRRTWEAAAALAAVPV